MYTYLHLPVLHLSYRWSCTISWVRTTSPSTRSSSLAPCWALTIILQLLTTCQLQVRDQIDLQVQIIKESLFDIILLTKLVPVLQNTWTMRTPSSPRVGGQVCLVTKPRTRESQQIYLDFTCCLYDQNLRWVKLSLWCKIRIRSCHGQSRES